MERNRSWGQVSFWDDESVLKSIVVMVVQFCEYTKKNNKLYVLNRLYVDDISIKVSY